MTDQNLYVETVKAYIFRIFSDSHTLTSQLFNARQASTEVDRKHWLEEADELLKKMCGQVSMVKDLALKEYLDRSTK